MNTHPHGSCGLAHTLFLLRSVPEDSAGLVVQWHLDDLTDSADGAQALSSQGIALGLVDGTNLRGTACGGTTRPLHSAVAAPVLHSEQPYVVASYLPGSSAEVLRPQVSPAPSPRCPPTAP